MKNPLSPVKLFIIFIIIFLSCNKQPSNPKVFSALEKLDLSKYISIKPSGQRVAPLNEEWEIFDYDTSDCKCIVGDEFFVAQRNQENSNNVVFWLAGGGACWPGQDACIHDLKEENNFDWGIAQQNPGNPVADWNFIYVPYCDGSVHMGDNNADYDNDGKTDHWHWGLRNTSAAVGLMLENYPNPDKILITGCSAGGYGTFISLMLIRQFYPQTPIYVFNESGPGIFHTNDLDTWDLIKQTWNIEPLLPTNCEPCQQQIMM